MLPGMRHLPPLGYLFQWFTTPEVKNLFLILCLNLPSFSLKPLLSVLLQEALPKRLSPSFLKTHEVLLHNPAYTVCSGFGWLSAIYQLSTVLQQLSRPPHEHISLSRPHQTKSGSFYQGDREHHYNYLIFYVKSIVTNANMIHLRSHCRSEIINTELLRHKPVA